MTVTREQILAYEDSNIGRVEVPEFGGEVCVATLSAAEADKISKLGEDGVPSNVGLVILGACDEDGKRLFKPGDAAALAKKPARALTKIAQKVLDHNGMGPDAAAEAKNASSGTESAASASA